MKKTVKDLIGKGFKIIPIVYSEEVSKKNINKAQMIKKLKKLGNGDYGHATEKMIEANEYYLENQKGSVTGIYKIGKIKTVITASIVNKRINCYHIYTISECLKQLQEGIKQETNEELIKILKSECIKLSR
ncbi:hypothetical protein [uncultured Tissierella sp.]|uniref:hypothetical protein n=1 Tax=uncultured Tissierella sp. TaxID=448160 RepID=UPI0028037B3E|nr:hypothetical protein [uncultured Tissierella sp.]MDU5080538.1 hypothetical protein [Bacillota bacterium]